MKSENQILLYDVISQSKFSSHFNVCCCFLTTLVKEIFLRLFCFYFLNALQIDKNTSAVYLFGHNYILCP